MAKKNVETSSFAFFDFLRQFYVSNRGRIRNRYKDLTKKFLDYNDKSKNPSAYLRDPQFEALEMYVFLKEFCSNAQVYDLFDRWYNRKGDFADDTVYMVNKGAQGQMTLYCGKLQRCLFRHEKERDRLSKLHICVDDGTW